MSTLKQLYRWAIHGGFLGKTPLHLGVILTHQCNLRCQYCNFPNDQVEEIPINDLLPIIKVFINKGILRIGISGGEPLTQPEKTLQILKTCKAKHIATSLNTNGYQLVDNQHILEWTDQIVISLDGPKHIHDAIRGDGSYDTALKAIELCTKKKKKTVTITVISRQNINSLTEIVQFAHTHRFKCFFQPVTQCDTSGIINDSLAISKEDIVKAGSQLLELKKKHRKTLGNSTAYLKLLTQQNGKKNASCKAGKFFSYLTPEGKTVPCHVHYKNDPADNSPSTCSGCLISPYKELDLISHLNISALLNGIRLS